MRFALAVAVMGAVVMPTVVGAQGRGLVTEVSATPTGNCDGSAPTEVRVTRARPAPAGAPPPQPAAPPPPPAPVIRFAEMDENGDGVITRAEWRGSARSFATHDWNGDG